MLNRQLNLKVNKIFLLLNLLQSFTGILYLVCECHRAATSIPNAAQFFASAHFEPHFEAQNELEIEALYL